MRPKRQERRTSAPSPRGAENATSAQIAQTLPCSLKPSSSCHKLAGRCGSRRPAPCGGGARCGASTCGGTPARPARRGAGKSRWPCRTPSSGACAAGPRHRARTCRPPSAHRPRAGTPSSCRYMAQLSVLQSRSRPPATGANQESIGFARIAWYT